MKPAPRSALAACALATALLGMTACKQSPVEDDAPAEAQAPVEPQADEDPGAKAKAKAAPIKHTLPKLGFAYNALEPHIDAKTMELHHTKHHQGYVDKLNAALAKHPDAAKEPLLELLSDLDDVPEEIRTDVRNNGGGHLNHTFFWTILGPNAGGAPSGEVAAAINETFGSFEAFKTQFDQAALSRFGSGWAWLIVNEDGKLVITSTPNQDSPMMEDDDNHPILALDVWEHAYYLKYENKRPEYVTAFWNVVNWTQVNSLYVAARKKAD